MEVSGGSHLLSSDEALKLSEGPKFVAEAGDRAEKAALFQTPQRDAANAKCCARLWRGVGEAGEGISRTFRDILRGHGAENTTRTTRNLSHSLNGFCPN